MHKTLTLHLNLLLGRETRPWGLQAPPKVIYGINLLYEWPGDELFLPPGSPQAVGLSHGSSSFSCLGLQLNMGMHVHTHIHAQAHTCKHTHIHTYTYMHTQRCVLIHTHAHTQTCNWFENTDAQEGHGHVKTGKEWSDAVTRNTVTTRSWNRQEGSSLSPQRERGPANSFISNFWPPEQWDNKFLFL